MDRILNHQYEITRKNPDEILLGERVGPGTALTPEQIEKALEKVLPPDTFEVLVTLKKECTLERIAALLHMLFDPPEASLALVELSTSLRSNSLILKGYTHWLKHLLLARVLLVTIKGSITPDKLSPYFPSSASHSDWVENHLPTDRAWRRSR